MNLLGSKTLETKRLILKASEMSEQKRLWEILMIPEVNKWYLVAPKKYQNDKEHWTWKKQEKYYKAKVEKSHNKDVFTWSVFLKPEYTDVNELTVIGQVSAQENGEDLKIRDIGWYIDPKYQGNGYATEAAKAMIDYMFREVKIDKIVSGAVKNNIASCRIFEKLNFKNIGEVEEVSPYVFYDGMLTFSKYELTKNDIDKENNMELVDLYNKQKEKINKTVDKRDVPEGLYRLSAHVWIENDKNQILMQQRISTAHKFPNMWSVTGGTVKAGETSLEGIIRELKEELGLNISKDDLEQIASYKRKFDFVDVWLLHKNIDLKEIKMQKEEVQNVKWFTLDEYENMIKNKQAIRSSLEYYKLYINPKF